MNAISVELLRLMNVSAVFAEELPSVVVVDFIKLSFRRKRHENDLRKRFMARLARENFVKGANCIHLPILRHQLNVSTLLLLPSDAVQVLLFRRRIALAILRAILKHSQQTENLAGLCRDFHVMRFVGDAIG